jgi:hypothetical protein
MTPQQTDFVGYDDAPSATDVAIARAVTHADAVVKDWSAMAYGALLMHASCGVKFTSEDVREAAEKSGLPSPPDHRAWGGIFRRAARAGRIRRVGFGEACNPQAHGRPVAVWMLIAS